MTSEVLQQLLLSVPDRQVITGGVSACASLSRSWPLASPLYNLFLNDTRGMFPDGEEILFPYTLLKDTICNIPGNPENSPHR